MPDKLPARCRPRLPWLRFALLIALIALWWLEPPVLERLPPSWTPWTPLDIDAPPDRWTRWRLDRLDSDPLACLSALSDARGAFRVLPDRDFAAGCSQHDAVSVRKLSARVEPFVLTCRAAVSLALWDRHVLQPAALQHFGQRVDRIEHFGSYACRNVYGRETGRRSRHASADALDVAAFVLDNGRRIRVASAWRTGDATSAFVRDLHRGACDYFDAVLGPDYNAAHRDHLHLDRGAYRACR